MGKRLNLIMETEKIIHKNLILAIIVRENSWQEGLNFASTENDYLQVGFWNYKKGHKLNNHIHLVSHRQVQKTQEVVFVKNGKLRADIFLENEKFLTSIILNEGDVIFFLNGGHGYEILEDSTKVLEVKNGPYPGPEKDRKRF
ncbi:MAG: hypothetical protein UR22_C0012G0018 [Parcubacteria group bacterium GW2011_GWC2_32_10]|nr:MAG: hypothetical protein UR22_C0012G0018 [Parcubacteria group bacterium GW2011_GWC2_32_10]